MTSEQPRIESEQEFNAALNELLRRADAGGLPVRGGWTCRNDAEFDDWDVVVTRVEKPDATE